MKPSELTPGMRELLFYLDMQGRKSFDWPDHLMAELKECINLRLVKLVTGLAWIPYLKLTRRGRAALAAYEEQKDAH